MGQIQVLASYKALTGLGSDLKALQETLAEYNLVQLLACFSKLQILLRTWENPSNHDEEKKILPRLLPRKLLQILAKPENIDLIVCGRITLLFLIKQSILFAKVDGRQITSQDEIERIGLCFLIANDLLLGYVPQREDSLLQKVAGLLPFSDTVSANSIMDLARTYLFLTKIQHLPETKPIGEEQDLALVFEEKCGLSYPHFVGLVYAASSRFTIQRSEEHLLGELAYLPPTYFSSMNLPSSAIEAFWQLAGAELDDLKTRLQKTTRSTDFSPIQATPLLFHTDGHYLCLDPGFLQDKAGKGLFWTLRGRLSDPDGDKLKRTWGSLFEQYLHWLWKENYLGSGQYFASPKFDNGNEAFDACLVEGSTLLAFEYKSSTLTSSAKLSSDEHQFGADLHKKFAVIGKSPKGVGQLKNSLERLCAGETVQGIDFQRIRKVFEIIVSMDEALIGIGVASHLDGFLRPHRRTFSKLSKKTFPPLFTVHVADLEFLLPYTDQISFAEMLDLMSKEERSRSGSIREAITKHLLTFTPGKDVIHEEFVKVFASFPLLFKS